MQPYLQQQRQPSQQQPQYMMGGMQSGMSSAMKPMAPMYMPCTSIYALVVWFGV